MENKSLKLKMRKLIIAKADPLNGQDIMDIYIEIRDKLPEFDSIEICYEYYEMESARLADALFNSLPQGHFDRLIIKLMEKKLSVYRGKTNS